MTAADDVVQQGRQAQQTGDLRRAEEHYRQALRANPRSAAAWSALGGLCAAQNRLVEAVACMRQSLEIEPSNGQRHIQLGDVLLRQKQYADAETAYRLGLEQQPNQVEALVNRGFALGELGRLEEALACYDRARTLAPQVPEVHHNRGNMLRELRRMDEALASYDEALRLRPDYGKACINKGVALVALARIDEAVVHLERGAELLPDLADAHNSLGSALSAQRRSAEAFRHLERALALNPDHADAAWNRSLLWLQLGDYVRGWPAFEARWRCKQTVPPPTFHEPRWDGQPLAGRTILLYGEQGLGDTLHFVRYAPLVKARGGRVLVQCQNALLHLLSRTPGIDGLVGWGATPPPFDVWLPLMSLPAVFGTTLETIPATIPYIFPDLALVEHWRRQLAALPGFRVGIVWQGSPRHAWDRHRSVSLSAFAPLAQVPGVCLVSLQKGPGAEQLDELADAFPVVSFGDLLDRTGPFLDTAAIIRNLDLVVTVDSAVAHLAGALGAPVWLALHRSPDWRWLLDRSDNPWYPTVRLFRQPAHGDWPPVFRAIADALPAEIARASAARPLLVEISAGELCDKIAILRIKTERIADPAKLANVQRELEALTQVRNRFALTPALADLEQQLREVNEKLWQIEDEIRLHEERHDFGAGFIELARAVYHTNDRRAAVKRAINDLLQSRLVEEKSYSGARP
jgi:tetratricopeptide (TPR) repeat protein